MHLNTTQSRTAWTEQEDDLLRAAVKKYGDRAWATVAGEVPGRSSKSCSDRWRNFLSPDIEHPRKSPFSEWEVAVVVQAQHRYGNNWKAISMLLPGRTNRAVKNLFVGNLKWGARLPEIQNRFLEAKTPLEDLLEVKPDYAGGPPKERPGILMAHQRQGAAGRAGAMSPSMVAGSTSSGSAWASDMTDHQTLVGSSMLGGLAGHMGQQQAHSAVRRPREGTDGGSPTGGMQTPKTVHKRMRTGASPQLHHHQALGEAAVSAPTGIMPGTAATNMMMMDGATPAMMAMMAGVTPIGAHGGQTLQPSPLAGQMLPMLMPSDVPGGLPPLQMGMGMHHMQQQVAQMAAMQQQPLQHLSMQRHAGMGGAAAAAFCSPISGLPRVPLPGSMPAGHEGAVTEPLLHGHHSNDSVMLQAIMDQILEDDDVLSDPIISKQLLGSPTLSSLLHTRISGCGGNGTPSPLAQGHAHSPLGHHGGSAPHSHVPGSFDGRAVTSDGTLVAAAQGQEAQAPQGLTRSSTWPQVWAAAEAEGANADAKQQQHLSSMVPMEVNGMPQDGPVMRTSSCGAALAGMATPHVPSPGAPHAEWWGGKQPAMGGAYQQPVQHHLSVVSVKAECGMSEGQQLVAGGGAAPAATQQQPQMMRMLCEQLQQENMLLMQRVQSLQEQLAGAPALAETGGVAASRNPWGTNLAASDAMLGGRGCVGGEEQDVKMLGMC